MSGDDDRPRRSWREIDQARSQASRGDRSGPRPRGRVAEARAKEATKAYLKDAGKLFSSPKADEFGKAMRDAHGSPGFAEACRNHLEQVGVPRDQALLSLMLDCTEIDLLSSALEALIEAGQTGELRASASLRTQLRLLAEHGDDNVAGGAEDLLALL